MTHTRIRTSLSRAPSSFTEQQIAARAKVAQVEAAAAGILMVRLDDPRLTWPERELCNQLVKKLVGDAMGAKQ